MSLSVPPPGAGITVVPSPDPGAGPGRDPGSDAGRDPAAAVSPRPGLHPYDGILLVSFGGPERPEEVMPFLENVTRGRAIPPERLRAVATHYLDRGGRSPINDENRRLLAALRAELDARGCPVPLYWGNRNWAPFLPDALGEARRAGARRVLAVLTSAYSSYSGCRQYREDLAAAVQREEQREQPEPEQGRAAAGVAAEGAGRLQIDRVRAYFNHPGFTAATVEAVLAGLSGLPEGARLVFVTHSLPLAMAQASGPDGGGYVAQHRDVAATVAAAAAERLGRALEWDLVYCSRSGPPGQPWLEPDIEDHLAALADARVPGALAVPIGFVSDHMEVVHDLDTAARGVARAAGLPFARAATVGTAPAFVAGLVDLMFERAAAARGECPPRPVSGGLGPAPDVCPVGCCPNPRGAVPAACGADSVRSVAAGDPVGTGAGEVR